jgi:hypothetical protein
MENTELSKNTVAFGLSLALASVVDGLLVVAKEKFPAVMTGMQRLTGHHWITHGAVVLVLFGFFGWLIARANGGRGIQMNVSRLLRVVVAGVVAGGLIIVGFYVIGE